MSTFPSIPRARTAHLPVQASDLGARHFTHPGAPTLPRLLAVPATATRDYRIAVRAGQNAGQALTDWMAINQIRSGCGRLLYGSAEQLQYHVIIRAERGNRPYIYGPPIVVEGVSALITATLTLGRSQEDLPLVHCHGAFVDGTGQRGGHFALEHVIAGSLGMVFSVSVFDDVELSVSADSETNYSILSPRPGHAMGDDLAAARQNH